MMPPRAAGGRREETKMGRFCRFILAIVTLAAVGLASAPLEAKNIGEDPPVRCESSSQIGASSCPLCAARLAGELGAYCSRTVKCTSGTCFSLTEGDQRESYLVGAVRSSTGAMLDVW